MKICSLILPVAPLFRLKPSVGGQKRLVSNAGSCWSNILFDFLSPLQTLKRATQGREQVGVSGSMRLELGPSPSPLQDQVALRASL